MERALVLALLAIGVAIAGCGGESAVRGEWVGTVDTVSGVPVINNPARPIWGPETAWRLEEDLSIGAVEGDPHYEFSVIADLETDDGGRIYVLDREGRRISIYDPSGTFIAAFGRRGGGPGEFEDPVSLHWSADTLVVWDRRLRRLSYFNPEGRLLRDVRVELPFGVSRLEFRQDGRVWAQRGPSYSMPPRPDVEGIGWLLVVDLGDQSVDTVLRWQDKSRIAARTENFMTMVPVYYQSRVQWTVGPDDRIYVARGETYEIELYAPAGTQIATIRRAFDRARVTAVDRDSVSVWVERRAEQAGPYEDLVRKNVEIREVKPAIADIVVSDDDYFWVRIHTENDWTEHSWDVLDPRGRYLGTVSLPPRLRVEHITTTALYGVWRDELDVQYVRRYLIRRPAGNSHAP